MLMIVTMIISSISVKPSSLADARLTRIRNGLTMALVAGATRMPAPPGKWPAISSQIARFSGDHDVEIGPAMPESSPAGKSRHFGFEIVQRANTGVNDT
jgi:hypothetical protein